MAITQGYGGNVYTNTLSPGSFYGGNDNGAIARQAQEVARANAAAANAKAAQKNTFVGSVSADTLAQIQNAYGSTPAGYDRSVTTRGTPSYRPTDYGSSPVAASSDLQGMYAGGEKSFWQTDTSNPIPGGGLYKGNLNGKDYWYVPDTGAWNPRTGLHEDSGAFGNKLHGVLQLDPNVWNTGTQASFGMGANSPMAASQGRIFDVNPITAGQNTYRGGSGSTTFADLASVFAPALIPFGGQLLAGLAAGAGGGAGALAGAGAAGTGLSAAELSALGGMSLGAFAPADVALGFAGAAGGLGAGAGLGTMAAQAGQVGGTGLSQAELSALGGMNLGSYAPADVALGYSGAAAAGGVGGGIGGGVGGGGGVAPPPVAPPPPTGGVGGMFGNMTPWQLAQLGLGGASSIYGMMQAGDIEKAGQQASAAADPFGQYRPYYGQKLQALTANPASIEQDPGYDWEKRQGEQALLRLLARDGYMGSGNEKIAAMEYNQNYASRRYNDKLQQLAQLAGAGMGPQPGLALNGQMAAAGLRGNALANLGYMAQSMDRRPQG